MPHLRFRGLTESAVKDLSRSLPKELATLLKTSEDNFTVEKVATTFFRGGDLVEDRQADPMVEMLWFDRGAEARAATATKITTLVKAHTQSEYIAVVFTDIPKDYYFENGQHF